MDLYVIRHGQSLENIGQADTPNCDLSGLGQKQAKLLAAFFKDIRLDEIFSSPFRRAIQTALPTAESQGLPIRLMADFGEMFLNYDGAPSKEDYAWETVGQLRREFPLVRVDAEDEASAYSFPARANETWEQVCERCERFWRRELLPLCGSAENRAIAVFGHGATTDALKLLCVPDFDLVSPYETNALVYHFKLDEAGVCAGHRMHHEYLGEHALLRTPTGVE